MIFACDLCRHSQASQRVPQDEEFSEGHVEINEELRRDLSCAFREFKAMENVQTKLGEEVWGQQGTDMNCVSFRSIDLDGGAEEVYKRVCGIHFDLGELRTHLPEVPADHELLPDMYTLQIVTK